MIAAILTLIARNWKIVALAGVIGFAGVQTWRIGNLKDDLAEGRRTIAALKDDRDGWKAAYEGSEAQRLADSKSAIKAATEASGVCDARVAEARRSARVIEKIVTKEPTYDASRCPVRERVDSRLLSDALQAPR